MPAAPPAAETFEPATPLGPARLHVSDPGRAPIGRLVLGHGAGGGVGAPDLVAVFAAATARGWQVVLVEQPWKVAGGRVAPRPDRLDIGWLAALRGLDGLDASRSVRRLRRGRPLIVGGRSAGARVACRTAAQLGAAGICCLAFPLHLPGQPERSRAGELLGPVVPALVVQGDRDPFGRPEEFAALGLPDRVELAVVPADHALSRPVAVPRAIAEIAVRWLGRFAPGVQDLATRVE